MYGLSLIDKFKSLDVYRKLPPDFVKPTYSGAMLSIISSVIMLLLFLNEFSSYREIKTSSQMFIDVNRGGDKLTINVDVELTHLPCSILSIDIQDVGSRFYTYVYTMAYAMMACAKYGKPFVVFDRPNPLSDKVDGNILNKAYSSFVGMYETITRHGMTIGELATLFNEHFFFN